MFTTRLVAKTAFFCFGLVLSCDHTPPHADQKAQNSLEQLKSQITALKSNNLDSALYYTNLAVKLVLENQLGTDELLHLQLHRSELFDQLGLADSAEQAIAYTEALLQSQEDPYQKALMSFCKGTHLFDTDQYLDAEVYLQEAGAYFLQYPLDPQAGIVFKELANFYTKIGQLSRAHEFLLKAKTSFSTQENKDGVIAVNIQLASLFSQQELHQELSDLIQEILSSLQPSGATSLAYTQLQQLGFAVTEILPDSALIWQQFAAQNALQAGDSINYYLSLTHINAITRDQKKLEEAVDYFSRTAHKSHFILASTTLGQQLLQNNDLNGAKIWLDRGLEWAKELNNPVEELFVLKKLQQWSSQAGGNEQLLNDTENIRRLKNKLIQEDAATTLEFMEKAKLLEQINHQKTLLAKQLGQQQQKIRFRNGLIMAMGLSFLLLGLGAKKIYEAAQRKKIALQVLLESYKTELQHLAESRKNETSITKPEVAEIKEKLILLLQQNKAFLQPGLKVEGITEELGISYKDFNQFLKDEYGTNFKNFINGFRVAHAKKLLLDPGAQHLTIEGIGFESGFGTKQSFYTAFQQILGVTPGEYKNILQKENEES